MLVKKKKKNRPPISNVQNAKKIFLSPNRVSTNFFLSVESNLGSGRFSLWLVTILMTNQELN